LDLLRAFIVRRRLATVVRKYVHDVCALYTSVPVLVIHSEEEWLALAMG